MAKKEKAAEERQLIKIEGMGLEEIQLAEQLYNSAGLDPVVDAGLKDYDGRLQLENKLINKVLGPRGDDIKGYGEAVAKRVAFAVYALLNKQYGGKVGDLRSYIMALEDERNRANARYDELMGRVVGILGEEYKESKTDSKAFMERLTTTLGEDLKESKIDHKALAEKLADIDGLRSQIKTLDKEKEHLKERYESQIAEHDSRIKGLDSEKATLTAEIEHLRSQLETLSKEKAQLMESHELQIAERDSRIKGLDSEKVTLAAELEQLKGNYEQLRVAIEALAGTIPYDEIRARLGEDLHTFLLKDSKVPDMVIDGVGKFIDFRKYLGMAAQKGAEEASKYAEQTLFELLRE